MQDPPGDVAAALRQGIALFQQGRTVEAEALLGDLRRRHPGDFNILHMLGLMLMQGRAPARGVALIREALGVRSDFAPAWNNLGNGLRRLGQDEEALRAYDRALALQPGFAEAHGNRGAALLALGRPQQALADFDAALAAQPGQAQLLLARADALLALGRAAEALAGYDAVIALAPNHAETFNSRGRALVVLGDKAAALDSFNRALELAPRYPAASSNRGNVLLATGRAIEALADHDRAVALEPGNFRAHNNRGNALLALKRLDEAQQSYERAIALGSAYAEAHWNLGVTLLLGGDFERGLEEYQYRHQAGFSLPQDGWPADRLWTGAQDIRGKTLLIHCEQGMGDTIQFCRYALMARDRGARVLLKPQAGLERLLATLGVGIVRDTPAFDFHVPLLDLPRAFATRPDSIPAPRAYLAAEPARVAQWREKLGADGFKIGICWQGNPTATSDIGRSFPLRMFAPVAALPDVRLIALQKGAGLEQVHDLSVEMPSPPFDDGPDAFLDTAAIMMNLDLVITSDTAVAHLAGALGRPVIVALQHVPDWRWLLDRDDSPWYPTMQLVRQHERSDWTGVIARIETHIQSLLAHR